MFYLYDLATYSKNYGSISTPHYYYEDDDDGIFDDHNDTDEDNQSKESLLWTDTDDEAAASAAASAWQERRRRQQRRRKSKHHHHHHPNHRNQRLLNIDEAIQSLGMGMFQYRIGLAAGMLLAADSMEVVILSFLSNLFSHHPIINLQEAENSAEAMNMVVFPAGVVGAIVWGMLSDGVGRRPVFVGAASTIAVFGVATAFCNSYGWLLVTRLLVAFGIGGLTVPFGTFSEFLPPSQRGMNLVAVQVFCILGALVVHLTLAQPQLQAWRQIVILLSIPSILAMGLGLFVVPESPRWLLAQDRQDEALAILRVAAKANGQDPDALFPSGTILYSHEPQESTVGYCTIFSSGWISLTSTLWTTYFGMSFLTHGTIALAVAVFANDARQQNYQGIFTAASQFLSLLIVLFLIDGFGRSSTQCLAYAMGGVLCLAISLLEDGDPTTSSDLLLVLTFLAHTCMFGGKCATWISTTEVLATELRSTGHGMANAISRIGGFISSYIVTRIYSLPSIGLALFVISLWTASAASKLPETNVKEMGVVYYPTNNNNHRRRRCCTVGPESST